MQDAFLLVWHKVASFDPARGSVRAWLLTILHHRAIDARRRRARPWKQNLQLATVVDETVAEPDVWGEVALGLERDRVRAALAPTRSRRSSDARLSWPRGSRLRRAHLTTRSRRGHPVGHPGHDRSPGSAQARIAEAASDARRAGGRRANASEAVDPPAPGCLLGGRRCNLRRSDPIGPPWRLRARATPLEADRGAVAAFETGPRIRAWRRARPAGRVGRAAAGRPCPAAGSRGSREPPPAVRARIQTCGTAVLDELADADRSAVAPRPLPPPRREAGRGLRGVNARARRSSPSSTIVVVLDRRHPVGRRRAPARLLAQGHADLELATARGPAAGALSPGDRADGCATSLYTSPRAWALR